MIPAHTTELDEEIDVLHFIGEHGVLFESADQTMAGVGQALALSVGQGGLGDRLNEVMHRLRSIDTTSAEPIAFVSVPFSLRDPVTAIVPDVTVTQEGTGISTVTTVGSIAVPKSFDNNSVLEAPQSFALRPLRSTKEWCEAVDIAIARMRDGQLDKVVMAREILVEADAPFSQTAIIRQLRRSYPNVFRFAYEGFVGASPELLIERFDRAIGAEMLAGTTPRSSDPGTDEALQMSLLRSGKDRTEHRYLAEMVTETLQPFTDRLDIPSVPQIKSLANVHHLATPVDGTLRSADTHVLDLVAALHPTPAVGGRPTNVAVEVIDELEEMHRGRYAGAIGWVKANGDGQFAVALRCAQLEGERARLFAGNGIVAASNSQRELEETQWKLQPMLQALIRP